MFGSKIIRNSYGSIKDKIKLYYNYSKNFPSWYREKIFTSINYFVDVKYKVTHLKETNFNLGIEHLYKNNLNDAILRLKLVDKILSPNDHQANYWLGWTYFLKNNYEKALYHLQRAFEADQIKLASFLQNYNNLLEIPPQIWHQYKNLTAEYYGNKFRSNNKLYLPYSFVSTAMNNITDLPDNYHILELGSNIGLVGYEVKKRFPNGFTFTGVESSEIMNKLVTVYGNIYDQLLEISISDFIKHDSNKYDVVLSFNSLAFTKNLLDYFNSIYSIVNVLGYFAFCLPIDNVTNLSLKRKEFIFTIADIKKTLGQTKFTILNSEELALEKNDKYYMVICKKNH
ncbi:MAG: methyltransferase domain-containing protein [Rickettsia endosymbiont of Sergentomyia squamirostris]|uniref:Methyltransferase domain-containing protein n=1 Tax=Candidatus Tisiphia endosymbiont of Sergentomyia squamirostris TaxID=3113639 RepID=A0AAT9G8X7_9RICK